MWSLSPANTHASTAGPDVWASREHATWPGRHAAAVATVPRLDELSAQQILRQFAGIWTHGTPCHARPPGAIGAARRHPRLQSTWPGACLGSLGKRAQTLAFRSLC